MKPFAVILVSGGMDSCVTAAIANADYEMAFLHLNYGQRTEVRELRAFTDIADFYRVAKRLVVDVGYLKEIGGSALTDEGIDVPIKESSKLKVKSSKSETYNRQPRIKYGAIVNHQSQIPITYVPFRNAHLLSIAASWAEVIGAWKIFIGAVEEDSSGYPDCREVFYKAFQEAINHGTKPETHIDIVAPILHLRKCDIVKEGLKLGAPFHLTWSCYRDSDIACGECESCVLRLKGFREAGVKDPLPYKTQEYKLKS